MTNAIRWDLFAPAAPWAGAALLIVGALFAAVLLWARWKPAPWAEASGMPWKLRLLPSIALGAGCAIVVWLLTPTLPESTQLGVSVGVAALIAVIGITWLGRAGEEAVRRAQQASHWQMSAERVAAELRHIAGIDAMLDHASRALMKELNATCIRFYTLRDNFYQLRAAVPAYRGEAPSFAPKGLLVRAFEPAERIGFIEMVDPLTGRMVNWVRRLRGFTREELGDEMTCIEALEAESAVAIWREAKLVGFFLIGGRLTSHPYTVPQRSFCVDVASEVGRMLDVLDTAETRAREREAEARRKTERELAILMRRRMAPPETTEIGGAEFGVAMELNDGAHAEFCDTVVLPGGALGLVMAEAESGALEAAIQMVRMQALLRSRFYVYGEDLREMLESVERALAAGENIAHPVRLLLGRYEAQSRRFVYINAGYHAPILLKNRGDGSETRRLSPTGRLLSSGGPVDWNVQEVELRRRDLLLCISPGLAEIAGSTPDSESALLEKMLDLEGETASVIATRLLTEASATPTPAEGPKEKPTTTRERSVIALRPSESATRPLMMGVRSGA